MAAGDTPHPEGRRGSTGHLVPAKSPGGSLGADETCWNRIPQQPLVGDVSITGDEEPLEGETTVTFSLAGEVSERYASELHHC